MRQVLRPEVIERAAPSVSGLFEVAGVTLPAFRNHSGPSDQLVLIDLAQVEQHGRLAAEDNGVTVKMVEADPGGDGEPQVHLVATCATPSLAPEGSAAVVFTWGEDAAQA